MRWTVWMVAVPVVVGCATSGEPIGPYDAPTSGVLLLDLQRDFLEAKGKLPVDERQVDPLLEIAAALQATARARGLPVVQVQNVYDSWDPGNLFRHGAAIRGTQGAGWDPRAPDDVDGAFEKSAPDAFSNDAFDAWLRERQVDHLIITGVYADGCVLWTARGALNRGYRVTVSSQGVAAGSAEARAGALEALTHEGVEVLTDLDAMTW